MKIFKTHLTVTVLLLLFIACGIHPGQETTTANNNINVEKTTEKPWMLGPFTRPVDAKPIIKMDANTTFNDPITGKEVAWQSKATFNPAAIVKK